MSNNGKGNENLQAVLRQIPGVDRLLLLPVSHELADVYGRSLVVEALRAALDGVRARILAGQKSVPMNAVIVQEARQWLEELATPTLRTVINATGVIIHTNLGRAPLSQAAIAAMRNVGGSYSNLEYDLEGGQRGSRALHAAEMLTRLTGAEEALVVNNNAAALLLMLSGLCQGREVIISRGQLVEIGGGFRVPDIMAQSGARLVEVGTTNRTHLRDYAEAISERTAAILVAHHSNFKIIGFASEPSISEVAELAHEHGLPLLYDQGSGALLDTSVYGLEVEPTVGEGLARGADVVTFSGDKLLGGPQAGILCGREVWVTPLGQHPLARALRPDKLCLAALSATLVHYLVGKADESVPVWQMIARTGEEIAEQAAAWVERLREKNVLAAVTKGESTVGGGSLPGATLPTSLVAVDYPDVEALAVALRSRHKPAIVGRIADNRFLVDPRTVLPEQEEALLGGLVRYAAPNNF